MNTKQRQRRHFLKQCGLGAAAVSISAAVPAYAVSRRKQMDALKTDVLVVGGGPAGRTYAWADQKLRKQATDTKMTLARAVSG